VVVGCGRPLADVPVGDAALEAGVRLHEFTAAASPEEAYLA
jgi:hypothetical protein